MSTNQGCFMSIHHPGAQWSQSVRPLRPKSPQQPSRTIGPDAIHSFSTVRGTEFDENVRNVSLYKTNQNYSRKQLVNDYICRLVEPRAFPTGVLRASPTARTAFCRLVQVTRWLMWSFDEMGWSFPCSFQSWKPQPVQCCELQFQTQMEEIMKYDGNIRQPLLKPLLGVNHSRTMSGLHTSDQAIVIALKCFA